MATGGAEVTAEADGEGAAGSEGADSRIGAEEAAAATGVVAGRGEPVFRTATVTTVSSTNVTANRASHHWRQRSSAGGGASGSSAEVTGSIISRTSLAHGNGAQPAESIL
ncbi:hypothetical protein [Actinoplanes awajinensis]|uniref:hypothetical protein n=1 Tax=Actinoplanes awajinensis TaxID=135946 RepID=UPI001E4E2E58|nr:hypothetical protein [Actinoplanes awajinensis]